jgi:undecaprenyl diphosphate synthase
MDGNGRWAQSRGLPRLAGHRAGTDNIRRVLEACVDFGVEILTIYAFSTENWDRPPDEVRGLMGIFGDAFQRYTEELNRKNVRIRHLGRAERVAPAMLESITRAVVLTRDNTGITLNVAFNYGGRAEIVDAVRRLIREGVPAEDLSAERFADYLYTAGQPDLDLVIRTAGEMRLSNFLIWQAAYAEYYSTPKYWPDFGRDELYEALLAYQQRDRRFGRVNE